MPWGRLAFYVAPALAVVVVTWLTKEPLLGLVVGWLILSAPDAVVRIVLEINAARMLGRLRPGCVKCQRLPESPTRAVELARPVRTKMRYRYFTNSFHCPDCGGEEYWADVLRRHRVRVPDGCSSLADMLTERTT